MRLRLAIIVLCVTTFGVGLKTFREARPEHERGVFGTDPPTPYVRFLPEGVSLGTVLVLHGLDANKEFMKSAAMAMADGGFDVYAVDLPGHGDSPAGISFDNSVRVVEQLLGTLGDVDVVVGHSMGGAVLTEVANRIPFPTMVLYSPAPMTLEQVHVERLLVVSGGLEAPQINTYIPRLIGVSGGRSFWWRYPWATHSTALFHPDKLRAVVRWMGGRADMVRARLRLGGLAAMAVAALVAPFALPLASVGTDPAPRREPLRPTHIILQYVAALMVAVILLRFVQPLAWVHLFATDYMLALILVAGLLLWRGRSLSLSRRGAAVAVGAAAYVLGVLAFFVGSYFVDLVPAGGGWYRLPILAAAGLPLFLYDEENLRRIPSWLRRWTALLATRGLLWSSVVTGVLLLNPGEGLLVLIMHLVVAFWLLLWGLTAFVARKTGEPAAAALFAALVQGWVFAAIFVRTS